MLGMKRLRSELARLKRDTRGSFIMVFGLTLVPMLGLLGLGVDFSAANRLKTGLDAANDAALLAGLTAALQYIEYKQGSTSTDVTNTAITNAVTLAKTVFAADAANLPLDTPKSKFDVIANYANNLQIIRTTDGLTLDGASPYIAASHNIFGELFGVSDWLVQGNATAAIELPLYTRFYMLLDISQSMGIVGLPQDEANLQALTARYQPPENNATPGEGGCIFGCHIPLYNTAINPVTNAQYCPANNCPSFESIAVANGIKMRIDFLRSAVSDVIGIVQSTQNTVGYDTIALGLYTMDQKVETLTPPTYNVTTLASFTNTASPNYIDLEGNEVDQSGPGDSYLTFANANYGAGGAVGHLASIITADLASQNAVPGNGASAITPLIDVIIVTDGLGDFTSSSCYATHCLEAFDSSACDYIKAIAPAADLKLGVVYTTYNAFPTWNEYIDTIARTNINTGSPTLLETGLTGCASTPSLYVEASNGPDVQNAIDGLFQNIVSQGRLTQ